MGEFVTKSFVRTKSVPLDAFSVIPNRTRLSGTIPVGVRYEGMQFYSIQDKKFYYFDQNLEATELDVKVKPVLVEWNERDANDNLDYSTLKTYLETNYDVGSIVRVLPLNVEFFIVQGLGSSDSKDAIMNNITPQIYFEKYEIDAIDSYGAEIDSFTYNYGLPENADVSVGEIIEGGQSHDPRNFVINNNSIVEYIPSISDVSLYHRGRFYKNGSDLYLCDGTTMDQNSLILIPTGNNYSVNFVLWNNVNLEISDCILHPYIELKEDIKNHLDTGAVDRMIYKVFEIIDDGDVFNIVEPNFCVKLNQGINSEVIVESRYNTNNINLIGVYHG